MFGRKHTDESRDAMSATRTAKIVAGEYDLARWAKKGEIWSRKADRLIPYRSLWEKRAIELLEDDSEVIRFRFEPLRIPYHREEGGRLHVRHYVPDFLVEYADGRRLLIEVKPACHVDAAINVAKFAAAREYCQKNGLEFVVWTQAELGIQVGRPGGSSTTAVPYSTSISGPFPFHIHRTGGPSSPDALSPSGDIER
jgi:hypothetical protein